MISAPPSPQHQQVHGTWPRRLVKRALRYVNFPFLLTYRGYGHAGRICIQGHVFRGMALQRPTRRKRTLRQLITLIKMFTVRTVPQARVGLQFRPGGQMWVVTTDDAGFFQFELTPPQQAPGWHRARITLLEHEYQPEREISVSAEYYQSGPAPYGVISDIDDTLLVSHIGKFWRNAYLLLTRSSTGRKPFQGAVKLYCALTEDQAPPRPLFYVSSSEWNLYEFLLRFMQHHGLPKGVLQLRDIKDHWRDFFRPEQRNHRHKLEKMRHLLQFFPQLSFLLLGDNSQHDPALYRELAEEFPQQVKAVYIRQVRRRRRAYAEQHLEAIRQKGIPAQLFQHSAQVHQHVKDQGWVS
jgi:phosphatidate phosphatase APP1